MENPTNIKLDFYNACRTNTVRAMKNNGHYNFPVLCNGVQRNNMTLLP